MADDLNKIPLKKSFQSKYDNADYQTEQETRDIATAYGNLDAMKVQKAYLENLKLQHELIKNTVDATVDGKTVPGINMYVRDPKGGTVKAIPVPLTDVMPIPTEYESVRFAVMRKLNAMAISKDGQKELRE